MDVAHSVSNENIGSVAEQLISSIRNTISNKDSVNVAFQSLIQNLSKNMPPKQKFLKWVISFVECTYQPILRRNAIVFFHNLKMLVWKEKENFQFRKVANLEHVD